MTSKRPYLIRAVYEWILDNSLTPYILVNAEMKHVDVPRDYVNEGRIILNINSTAVHSLQLGNDRIEFGARFNGVAFDIHIPVEAVLAIYAKENGQGMAFTDEKSDSNGDEPPPPPHTHAHKSGKSKDSKPNLKLIK